MSPDEMKQFDDPLMESVGASARQKNKKLSTKKNEGGAGASWVAVAAIVLLATGLVAVTYFLYQAQMNIQNLDENLTASQMQLAEVSERLELSQQQLTALDQGLDNSQNVLAAQKQELAQYKGLYRDLRSQQSEQGQNLEALAIRKADQENLDRLNDRTAGIEGQVGEIDSRVGQINNNVSDLRQMSERNRQDITQNQTGVDQLRQVSASNSDQIAAVRNSLEREYYSFELPKNGSVIKVFDIALSLKDTDFSKQRYHMEILAGGKRLRKKGQNINEPIVFYVGDSSKPYELVVNRVEKRLVAGHLSVPKS